MQNIDCYLFPCQLFNKMKFFASLSRRNSFPVIHKPNIKIFSLSKMEEISSRGGHNKFRYTAEGLEKLILILREENYEQYFTVIAGGAVFPQTIIIFAEEKRRFPHWSIPRGAHCRSADSA